MCGMRTMMHNKDITPGELKEILKNDLFSDIKIVGLNGGEPFILENLIEYVCVIIDSLSSLKDLYVISNGFFTQRVLDFSKSIKALCQKRNIKYHLSISIDGYGDMQDLMRGHKNAFKNGIETGKIIKGNRACYCDDFGIICTITKINVYNLAQIDSYAKLVCLPITYNIATIHKRLNNDYKYEDFSIFTDERAQMMAAEFFYSKFLETKKEFYFARYYFVKNSTRIAVCGHRSQVVTITPNGNISYCATHSKELGSAIENKANDLFFNRDNLKYRKDMQNEYCNNCSHYSDGLTKKGYKLYFKELKKQFRIR